MKVRVFLGKEKVFANDFESMEDAEANLQKYLAEKGYGKDDLTVEEIADTHKKYHLAKENLTYSLIKHIEVVAAILIVDGKVFSTQRGYGEFKDGWEFPGGKMEPGESMQQALERELREELAFKAKCTDLVKTIEYTYPKFHLTMHCIKTEIVEGKPNLLEHEAAIWVDKAGIDKVNWLPADLEVVEEVKKML